MAADPLSAAVLGLGPQGQSLLEAAQASGLFQIKAVGDPDRQRAEHTAARYGCDAYTDYRQLIVQNQLDALLVAADIHTCDEYVKAALRKKFNILKLAPPARTFAEALEFAELAQGQNVRFVIANPLRFRSSFRTAQAWIAEGRISQIFLITAQSHGAAVERANWQSDPLLAGGGVLLHDGYPMLDQILWDFAVPQQVYAIHSSQAPDKQQRLYLTEDTAVVSLKFTDALTGSLVATRDSNLTLHTDCLKIQGRDHLLTVTGDQVILTNLHDGSEQASRFQESDRDIMIRLLDSFACNVRTPDGRGQVSSLADNLKNMAVLESAYLSARTGFPEEPDRMLQQAKNFLPAGMARI
jgi:UDP-N-acetyl-2-amino-2-deoxyglucuronate dehydrogenase